MAVANELKKADISIRIFFVGEKNSKFGHLLTGQTAIDQVYHVHAGKFRRYQGESWLKRLFDFKTNWLNFRDFFLALTGFMECWKLLRRLRPNVIFIKGGFVGVPVGLAAAVLKIPFITHDSDAISGLTNRLIGRWAAQHAVALPVELYNFPPQKTHFTGIPLDSNYHLVNHEKKLQYRHELNLDEKKPVLFITGGSQGALRLNNFVAKAVPELLTAVSGLQILHQTGQTGELYEALPIELQSRVATFKFAKDLYRYSGAADVVISRAGATSIAELAAQGKAAILVPNAELTGGHQVKNADFVAGKKAALVISEERLKHSTRVLVETVKDLLESPHKRAEYGENLHKLSMPEAAKSVAELILKTGGKGSVLT